MAENSARKTFLSVQCSRRDLFLCKRYRRVRKSPFVPSFSPRTGTDWLDNVTIQTIHVAARRNRKKLQANYRIDKKDFFFIVLSFQIESADQIVRLFSSCWIRRKKSQLAYRKQGKHHRRSRISQKDHFEDLGRGNCGCSNPVFSCKRFILSESSSTPTNMERPL